MSTAGNSYEAWKESLKQAEAAGVEGWDESGEPVTAHGLMSSIVEVKGLATGVLLGAGLMLAAAVIFLLNVKHLALGERTIGIVVGHKDFYNRRSCSVRAPIVNYSAPGGAYRAVGGLSVASSIYPVGKEVSVLYLPKDPSNAVIFDFVQIFLIPTVVGGVGLICLVGTTGLSFWIIRNELPGSTAAASTPKRASPAQAVDGAKSGSAPRPQSASPGTDGHDARPDEPDVNPNDPRSEDDYAEFDGGAVAAGTDETELRGSTSLSSDGFQTLHGRPLAN